MNGNYQHCSEQHFQRYLNEFAFRSNNRIKLGVDDAQQAAIAVHGAFGKRLIPTALCSDRFRHCEERSDAATQGRQALSLSVLDCRAARAARNDDAPTEGSEQRAVGITYRGTRAA